MIGPNGAGKSTLLKTIYGLVPARAGSIRLLGDEITRVRADRLTRAGVNFVPQVDNVFPSLSVAENLKVSALPVPRSERGDGDRPGGGALPDRARARTPARRDALGRPAEARRARARASSPGRRCSCSTSRPPGSHRRRSREVFEKLGEIASLGIGIVMVEQNARRALALSHRGYVLDMGRNAFEGTGRELLADPKVAALYLGRRGRAATEPAPGA